MVISPHATVYADYFHVSPGKDARGDFGHFGALNIKISAVYDETFVSALSALSEEQGFTAARWASATRGWTTAR